MEQGARGAIVPLMVHPLAPLLATLLSPTAALLVAPRATALATRWTPPALPASRSSAVRCATADPDPPTDTGAIAVAAAGLVANLVVPASLYSVATTGGGLPAGPFGLVGALEGVSYLVIVGFVGAALRSKLTTGSGLPAGPYGLTGAAEGLSFLSVLAGLVVLAQLQLQQGCVPNALPLADYSAVVNVCK